MIYTTALEYLKNEKLKIIPKEIKAWLDFGTPDNLLSSHKFLLKKEDPNHKKFINTTIIAPCFISDNVDIKDSIIGPYVSISSGCKIISSKISNSIIQSNSTIQGGCFQDSIIGRFVTYKHGFKKLNIGDYSTLR